MYDFQALDSHYNSKTNTLTHYNHVPSDLLLTQSYAYELGVIYKDRTPEELMETIESINAVFRLKIEEGKIDELYDLVNLSGPGGSGNYLLPTTTPFSYGVWNRVYEGLNPGGPYNGYNICFVNGHVGEYEKNREERINIDSDLGKGELYRDINKGDSDEDIEQDTVYVGSRKKYTNNIIGNLKFVRSLAIRLQRVLPVAPV